MIDIAKQFFTDNSVLFGSLGGVAGTGAVVWGIVKSPFSRKPKLELGDETVAKIKPEPQSAMNALSVVEFIRIRKELKADILAELETAPDAEKEVMRARIAELENQINNPEPALAEAQKRIADLESLLDREGNDIGADRIAAAKAAMEAGDYGLADEIFAEIEAREEIAVQRAARAAFGRGEVAEAEIRWHDAYTHYKRAKELDETEEHLASYAHMTWRLAKGAEAVLAHEQLVDFTKATYSDSSAEYASQLNNLGAVLKAQGQLSEAERLLRQALAIGEATIGTEHPSYAIRLNNLASVLKAQGQFSEAKTLYRQALAIGEATIGTEHPDYAIRLNNLADVLKDQGQFEQAREFFEQALDILTAKLPANHPDIALVRNNLASLDND